MPQTIIGGNQSTGNINQLNIQLDITDSVYKLFASETPFLSFSQKLGSASAAQSKFEWFSNDDRIPSSLLDGAIDAVQLTITVDNGDLFLPNETLMVVNATTNARGEYMRIVSKVANVLTVVRGIAGTTAAVASDNDIVYNIGNSQVEYSDIPDAAVVKLDNNFNYTQIMRTTTTYSKTFFRTHLYTSEQEIHSRREEKSREHKLMMERMFIFGKKAIENGSSSQPRRYTGGLLEFNQEAVTAGYDINETVAGAGAITESEWNAYLEQKVFAYGSQEKVALCSKRVLGVINDFARDKQRLTNMVTEFGVKVTRYETTFGSLMLVAHQMFEQQNGMKNSMLVYDPMQVKKRSLGGAAEIEFESDVLATGKDGGTDEWRSELGLEYGVPATTSLIDNVVSSA